MLIPTKPVTTSLVMLLGHDTSETEMRVLAYLVDEGTQVLCVEEPERLLLDFESRLPSDEITLKAIVEDRRYHVIEDVRLKQPSSKPNYVERPYGRDYRRRSKR